MEPLAIKLRPKKLDEICGNLKLVGEKGILRKMIDTKKYQSFILFGNAGSGKTSISKAFSNESNLYTVYLNGSNISKQDLVNNILNEGLFGVTLLIIDEIHRIRKDIQDYLLEYVEEGKVVFIGLTNQNPYFTINHALRSRVLLFEVKDLDKQDLKNLLNKSLKKLDVIQKFEEDSKDLLVNMCLGENRLLFNYLELVLNYYNDKSLITSQMILDIKPDNNLKLDSNEDYYYNLLSGLQKSIRGSDIDASLYYLAKLILIGDIHSIFRRLIVIASEDIGLANPKLIDSTILAYDACLKIGLPESRIIMSNIVILLAVSPKSNSAYLAIDKALDIAKNTNYNYIDEIDNLKIKNQPSLYKYSHDNIDGLNSQRYIPKELENIKFYIPKQTSNYEIKIKERKDHIDKIKNIK